MSENPAPVVNVVVAKEQHYPFNYFLNYKLKMALQYKYNSDPELSNKFPRRDSAGTNGILYSLKSGDEQ
jgi:hypothetical protein